MALTFRISREVTVSDLQGIAAWVNTFKPQFQVGDIIKGFGTVHLIDEDGKANGRLAFGDAKFVLRRNRELGVVAIWRKQS